MSWLSGVLVSVALFVSSEDEEDSSLFLQAASNNSEVINSKVPNFLNNFSSPFYSS